MISSAPEKFRTLGAVTDFPLEMPSAVELDGREVCVLRLAETVIVFANRCPHRGHPLSEGKCVDGNLRCALHGWEFSLPGGEAVSPRAPFGLELLSTRIVDGTVEVAT